MQFYNIDNQYITMVQYNCKTAVRRTYFLIKHPYTFILAMVVYGAESHAPQSGSRRMRRTLLAKWRGVVCGNFARAWSKVLRDGLLLFLVSCRKGNYQCFQLQIGLFGVPTWELTTRKKVILAMCIGGKSAGLRGRFLVRSLDL